MSASPVLRRCTRLLLLCVILSCDRQSALEPRPDLAEPAHDVTATVTQILLPDSAYRATTRLINLAPIPHNFVVTSVTDGWMTINHPPLMKSELALLGVLWACPPESETPGCLPSALVSSGPIVELQLSRPVTRFGVEIQPNVAGAYNFSATFYLGASPVGSVSRFGVSSSNARLLAGNSDQIFDRVIISSTVAFTMANIRYQAPNPTITLTPATHQVLFLRPALPLRASSVAVDPSYRPRFTASGTPKAESDAPAGVVEQIALTGTTLTRSFEVGNTGYAMLEYTASTPNPWLAVSPTDGGVAPGGKVRVDAAINSTALPLGPSAGTITVSDPNATNPGGLTGTVNVSVEEAGILVFANPIGPFLAQPAGSLKYFILEVPDGLSEMSVRIRPGAAGSGDADLYVRYGEPPTTGAYDCRPFSSTSNETCTTSLPRAGTYYVMLRGFSAYNDVTLDVIATGVPIRPLITNVQNISSSILNLFWQDRSVNEGSYRLQRLLVNEETPGAWQALATLPANSYFYADSTVVRDSTYRYRVRACNATGCSAWTYTIPLTIPGPTIGVSPGSLSFLFLRGEDGSALVSTPPSGSEPRAQFTAVGAVPAINPSAAPQDATMAETASATFSLSAQYEAIEWTAVASHPWLYANPDDGSVNAGHVTAVAVNVDATSLALGVHEANIAITDPNAGNSGSLSVYADIRSVPVLQSGVAVTGLSGTAGSQRFYMVNVPPGTLKLTTRVFGEVGAANLYVRQGAPPLLNKYDCVAGETCTTNFPPAGVYYVMIYAPAGYTGATLVATLGGAPLPPSAVATTVMSSSTVRINWTDASTNETYFATQQRTKVADVWSAWTNAGTPGANATTHTFTGLTPETMYQYRLRSCNADGCSTWAAGAEVPTPAAVPPAVPTPVSATVMSATEITLVWPDVSYVTNYQVQRSTQVDGVFGGYVNVGQPDANTTNFVDIVAPATTYRYRVRACNLHGCSAFATSAIVTTPADPTVIPLVPVSVSAVAVSSTQIDVSWPDVAGETSYQIQRRVRVDGVFGPFTLVGTLPANSASYNDTGLNPGGTYNHRVRACNAAGCSLFKLGPTVTTPGS
jgi:hypothetical protein